MHWITAAFENTSFKGRLHNIMMDLYSGFVLVVTYKHMMKYIT